MIPVDQLHHHLVTTDRDLLHLGAATWQRFEDWAKTTDPSRDSNRGGGVGNGKTDTRIEDEAADRQAAGYHAELDQLTRRIEGDLHRLRRLLRIANPDRPRSLHAGDMTNAQLVADGWCPSCFRNNKHLSPVAEGRYRDRCRPCGDLRGREGRDPNLDELRLMHSRGKSVRQRIA